MEGFSQRSREKGRRAFDHMSKKCYNHTSAFERSLKADSQRKSFLDTDAACSSNIGGKTTQTGVRANSATSSCITFGSA